MFDLGGEEQLNNEKDEKSWWVREKGRAVGWERPRKKKAFVFNGLWKGCFGL